MVNSPYAYDNPKPDAARTWPPEPAATFPIQWLIEAYEAEDSQAQPISGDATLTRKSNQETAK